MKFVSLVVDGTVKKSSFPISPFVCSSIFFMQPGMVIRCISLCFFGILPTSDTGWKLTALTTSLFVAPNLTMAPS